jgi:hypothetical protein
MTHIADSIGRGQGKWLGERSLIVFPTQFPDLERETKLGCARCLLWGLMFEGAICIALILVWILWLSIR